MVLTGRAGLIALICVLPIAISPWPAVALVVLLAALVAVVIVDVALAASARRLNCSRLGETAARLGQPVDAVLVVENPKGQRRFRGQIRDAWAPSARAEPRQHTVNLAAGQQVRLLTQLRPVRRGDQRSALVTARSIGPLGLAGRQSSHRVPWQIRILPPFLSRKHLPSRLAKLRELFQCGLPDDCRDWIAKIRDTQIKRPPHRKIVHTIEAQQKKWKKSSVKYSGLREALSNLTPPIEYEL